MIECDNLGDGCNGVQKVNCIDRGTKITKSTMKTLCTSRYDITQDPNCEVLMYAKDSNSENGIILFDSSLFAV